MHNTLTANLQPRSALDKVQALLDGVGPCGLFQSRCDRWKDKNPSCKHSPRWPLLSMQPPTISAPLSHPAPSATVLPPTTSAAPSFDPAAAALIVATVIELMASKSETSAAVQTRTPAPTSDRTPRPPDKRLYLPFDNNQYCWTHGCGHASDACQHQADYHKKEATLKNNVGGAPA